jgi:hypothetical protein
MVISKSSWLRMVFDFARHAQEFEQKNQPVVSQPSDFSA